MTCLVSTLTQWPYHARTCGVTETLEILEIEDGALDDYWGASQEYHQTTT